MDTAPGHEDDHDRAALDVTNVRADNLKRIPDTGTDTSGPLWWGAGLVAAGVAVIATARRRGRASHPV